MMEVSLDNGQRRKTITANLAVIENLENFVQYTESLERATTEAYTARGPTRSWSVIHV